MRKDPWLFEQKSAEDTFHLIRKFSVAQNEHLTLRTFEQFLCSFLLLRVLNDKIVLDFWNEECENWKNCFIWTEYQSSPYINWFLVYRNPHMVFWSVFNNELYFVLQPTVLLQHKRTEHLYKNFIQGPARTYLPKLRPRQNGHNLGHPSLTVVWWTSTLKVYSPEIIEQKRWSKLKKLLSKILLLEVVYYSPLIPRKKPNASISPATTFLGRWAAETTETVVENFVFPIFLEKYALFRKMSRNKK